MNLPKLLFGKSLTNTERRLLEACRYVHSAPGLGRHHTLQFEGEVYDVVILSREGFHELVAAAGARAEYGPISQ